MGDIRIRYNTNMRGTVIEEDIPVSDLHLYRRKSNLKIKSGKGWRKV